jgi:riboflavin kinase/FMN adenylyltransferase
MRILYNLADVTLDKASALSIGVFDGVHIGHRYLIDKLMESARSRGFLGGVVTFDAHPDNVLAPQRDIRYLTTIEEKLTLLGEVGLDLTVVLAFTGELAQTPARDFILSLMHRLRMRELWIGPDFALGRDRQGDAAYLRTLGHELGFRLEALQPLLHEGEAISSTNIRGLLREGRLTEASHLLGRYPTLKGKVVSGARRGQNLGFPTANLAVDREMMIPANGIYAVRVRRGTANHQGVVNIGVRPTFEDHGERIVEAHILDFTGDLYGQILEIEFVGRLRSEKRFESAQELIAQMNKDIAHTRRLFHEQLPAL